MKSATVVLLITVDAFLFLAVVWVWTQVARSALEQSPYSISTHEKGTADFPIDLQYLYWQSI